MSSSTDAPNGMVRNLTNASLQKVNDLTEKAKASSSVLKVIFFFSNVPGYRSAKKRIYTSS